MAYVVAKVARADTSTDPAPLNMTETIVHLKPRDAVAARHDARSAARRDGRARCSCRASSNIWTMPIINRIDMLTTGIRSEVGVKVFGTDLTMLEASARRVADVRARACRARATSTPNR